MAGFEAIPPDCACVLKVVSFFEALECDFQCGPRDQVELNHITKTTNIRERARAFVPTAPSARSRCFWSPQKVRELEKLAASKAAQCQRAYMYGITTHYCHHNRIINMISALALPRLDLHTHMHMRNFGDRRSHMAPGALHRHKHFRLGKNVLD